jgi:hypothetical protein
MEEVALQQLAQSWAQLLLMIKVGKLMELMKKEAAKKAKKVKQLHLLSGESLVLSFRASQCSGWSHRYPRQDANHDHQPS